MINVENIMYYSINDVGSHTYMRRMDLKDLLCATARIIFHPQWYHIVNFRHRVELRPLGLD